MPDREKVIKWLECCTCDLPLDNKVHFSDLCELCPYYNKRTDYCFRKVELMRDALALLKEQEASVRCKDCKKQGSYDCHITSLTGQTSSDDWFCADGEKRE